MPNLLPLPAVMNSEITDQERFTNLMSILNSKFLPFAGLGKTYFEPIIDWRNALVQKLAEEVHLIKTQYLQAHANPAQASTDWWKQEYILWFGFGQVAKHQIRGMYETHAEICRLPPFQIAKTLPATFVDYFLHLCDVSFLFLFTPHRALSFSVLIPYAFRDPLKHIGYMLVSRTSYQSVLKAFPNPKKQSLLSLSSL